MLVNLVKVCSSCVVKLNPDFPQIMALAEHETHLSMEYNVWLYYRGGVHLNQCRHLFSSQWL